MILAGTAATGNTGIHTWLTTGTSITAATPAQWCQWLELVYLVLVTVIRFDLLLYTRNSELNCAFKYQIVHSSLPNRAFGDIYIVDFLGVYSSIVGRHLQLLSTYKYCSRAAIT